MGFGPRASLAAILGFAAAFAVACGSSGNGLLSSAQSSSIAAQLTSVQAAVDAGHCTKAATASRKLTDAISSLPSGVNQKLFANLGQGAATVAQLAAKDCGKTQSTATATVTSTTATQSSTTATQASSTTQSAPATTTTSAATTSTPQQTQTGGGTGTAKNTTTQGGGAPVGGGTKTSGG
jgi:Zn-dependent M28 family amino/carboxypeptidase